MFCEMPQKFDLRFPDDYVAFLTIWAKTEFAQATKVEMQLFWSLKPRPTDFRQLFRILMDEYARGEQCKFWLQKTSPFRAEYALTEFKDAKVIVVTRELGAAAHSHITSENKQFGNFSEWKTVFRKRAESSLAQRICEQYQGIHITYEGLIDHREQLMQRICKFIGIQFEPEVLETAFAPNSSFDRSAGDGDRFRRPAVPTNIRWLATLATLIPGGFFRLANRRNLYNHGSAQNFIRGTFYTQRKELADREFHQ